jgi:branched-chain amino acid transport system substrate-binding protein
MIRAAALLSLALAAPIGAAAQAPLVVGAALPRSGLYADLAAGYARALLLWQDEVNASGGLLGRRVELRLLDDGSRAVGAGTLYEKLIREEKADLLIGPYGSAATLGAAAAAERARHVLVNGTGALRAVHKRSPRYVFQVAPPYAAYGAGVLEVARGQGLARLYVFARDDPASREMAGALRDAATAAGLAASGVETYKSGTTDFAPQVAKAHAARAEAWIAFGEVRDAAEMVKTFKRLDYAPKMFFAQGAGDPKFVALVGQDAEYALGLSEYEESLATPGNEAFVKAYRAKWSSGPGLAAAQGYAAAKVAEEALKRAGSLDQERLRDALAALDAATVLGRYKVDPATGEQLAARPAVVQIVKGRREVAWPPGLATVRQVLPYAPWGERKLLQPGSS